MLANGSNSYQITPERHLSLARLMSIEMARIHGPLSVRCRHAVVGALESSMLPRHWQCSIGEKYTGSS